MTLDALAPDQRAVVQLVLQQDRSYEDLAGLLGITAQAVRERALRGLERLAPGEALATSERETVADYLLGQQSVSERESTRALLTASQPARSWAHAVSVELAAIARSPLPEIPAGADRDPVTAQPRTPAEPESADNSDQVPSDPATPTRARPRPRQRAEAAPADFGFSEVAAKDPAGTVTEGPLDDEPQSTSRLGGALLIAGLAILVAALIVFLIGRGEDDSKPSGSTETTTEESSATATPGPDDYQAQGVLQLKPQGEATGNGILVLFATTTGEFAINVEAEELAPNGRNEAYGLWLTGGAENYFLGFATANEDGTLQASGPQEQDAPNFTEWLTNSRRAVVSLETANPGTEPGQVVLQGNLNQLQAVGTPEPGATATP